MLNKHFREFIALLESQKVKYLLVGGYAVGWHGFPRYTGDLDIFIAISQDNAEKMLQVFDEFGFSDLSLEAKDFIEEEVVIEIGREPLKIQVLTGIDGVTFEECYSQRAYFVLDGLRIPLIGYEELLRNKRASPRAKDKIDFEQLLKLKGNFEN